MDQQADILVLGTGVAGLTAALEAARTHRVLLVSKAASDETNTARAQGGIASVFDPEDSFEEHVRDTLETGAGLCNPEIVSFCVRESPGMIQWLQSMGAGFETTSRDGRRVFDLGREGGHSKRRIVHAKDRTGRKIEDALLLAAREHPNIHVMDQWMAVDLITLERTDPERTDNRCIGCYVIHRQTGDILALGAKATILATGGSGKVYLYTSNSDVATGDGVAMGWRCGATVANMEFFQFHPTCLYHPQAKNFLMTEALRGEGALLLTRSGHRFMPEYSPQAELAPRDLVARAIDEELKKTGDDFVLLDISHKPAGFVEQRFPQVFEFCLSLGIDLRNQPAPVVPAAHYQCGGIRTNEYGWTGIPGLYAIGEVACTGMHGANRLASNSLLEALVFGARAAKDAIKWLRELPPGDSPPLPAWVRGLAHHPDESVVVSQNWDEVRRFMWNYVGVVRSDNRLARARKRIDCVREEVQSDYWRFILTPEMVELRNLVDVAQLILDMASMRKESRGLHYNLDHPDRDDNHWNRDTILIPPPRRRAPRPRL
jgi:L-aspartate oxidase